MREHLKQYAPLLLSLGLLACGDSAVIGGGGGGGGGTTPTTITLSASAASVTRGTSVALTASVNPRAATGTVRFLAGTGFLGTAPLSAGSATLTTAALAVGTHSLTAAYVGSSSYAASTSNLVTLTVTEASPAGRP